jgi:hypothetical protein
MLVKIPGANAGGRAAVEGNGSHPILEIGKASHDEMDSLHLFCMPPPQLDCRGLLSSAVRDLLAAVRWIPQRGILR